MGLPRASDTLTNWAYSEQAQSALDGSSVRVWLTPKNREMISYRMRERGEAN